MRKREAYRYANLVKLLLRIERQKLLMENRDKYVCMGMKFVNGEMIQFDALSDYTEIKVPKKNESTKPVLLLK